MEDKIVDGFNTIFKEFFGITKYALSRINRYKPDIYKIYQKFNDGDTSLKAVKRKKRYLYYGEECSMIDELRKDAMWEGYIHNHVAPDWYEYEEGV